MAFCRHCGTAIQDGAANCGNCGVATAAVPMAVPAQAGTPGAGVQAPVTVPAQPGSSSLALMWASFATGARVAGIAGLTAIVGFFLPYYANPGYSANGVNLAENDFTFWFRLLFALVAIGLLWFDYNNDLRTKIIVGTAQSAIGAAYGLQFFQIMRGGEYATGLGVGWYLTNAAFVAIAVGGFMSVLHHSRRLAGMR